jgi:hypothetical protein
MVRRALLRDSIRPALCETEQKLNWFPLPTTMNDEFPMLPGMIVIRDTFTCHRGMSFGSAFGVAIRRSTTDEATRRAEHCSRGLQDRDIPCAFDVLGKEVNV